MAFVLSLTDVCVLLGVSLGVLGGHFLVNRDWLVRVASLVTLILRLQPTGAIRVLMILGIYRQFLAPIVRAAPWTL